MSSPADTDWIDEAYEDRFFIEETDLDDGFTWGWAHDIEED